MNAPASTLELMAMAQEFLAREAKFLDERRFWDWYALLDDALEYYVPIRQSRLAFGDEVEAGSYRISDNKQHIHVRIKRVDSGAGWAETPPSRTLRVVGSVLVAPTEREDVIAVESALLLYRQRGHDERGDVIPVRRQDLLRITDGGLRLLKRNALLAEAVLSTPNLGVFL
ncbi:aromatic-ring-hydroxylating dioxygenase subunit beta [Massilia niastensis]|uniref:aromatic-ring-hydroxylating dioxygenase subunit beta n=1 Tax=Massilia niastensis TaxID=544911 RepID=UPI000369B70B|nr:aromatic-ring-hydroxylating dioxygenase subunit beta [Massilia niastensis]